MAKAKGIRAVGYVDVRGHVKASGWLEKSERVNE
jgi:hypothetical protein